MPAILSPFRPSAILAGMPAPLPFTLKAIVAGMRALGVIRTVKYHQRTAGTANADNYDAGVDYDAYRGPMTRADINGESRIVASWHLYGIGGQTVKPSRLGKIVDTTDVLAGETWHVDTALRLYGDLKHDCLCVLEV